MQRTGLLSMLDVECSIRGTAESYVSKVKVQHKHNPRLFESRTVDCRSFGIQHFAGRVAYDASDFLGKFATGFSLLYLTLSTKHKSCIPFLNSAWHKYPDNQSHVFLNPIILFKTRTRTSYPMIWSPYFINTHATSVSLLTYSVASLKLFTQTILYLEESVSEYPRHRIPICEFHSQSISIKKLVSVFFFFYYVLKILNLWEKFNRAGWTETSRYQPLPKIFTRDLTTCWERWSTLGHILSDA